MRYAALIALGVLFFPVASSAYQEMTCWYDEAGNYNGADDGNYDDREYGNAEPGVVTPSNYKPWRLLITEGWCPEKIEVPNGSETSSEG